MPLPLMGAINSSSATEVIQQPNCLSSKSAASKPPFGSVRCIEQENSNQTANQTFFQHGTLSAMSEVQPHIEIERADILQQNARLGQIKRGSYSSQVSPTYVMSNPSAPQASLQPSRPISSGNYVTQKRASGVTPTMVTKRLLHGQQQSSLPNKSTKEPKPTNRSRPLTA